MARKSSRPGRTLIVFALVVLAMYGGLALNGNWTPKLGLDLQGGTRITLQASTETGESVTPEKLDEAASIIDSRVNAQGVAESEVSTQGENNIIVEIPGNSPGNLLDAVKRTAQLRFRLVATSQPTGATPAPTDAPAPSTGPDATPSPDATGSETPSPSQSPSPTPAGRVPALAKRTTTPTPSPTGTPAPEAPQAPAAAPVPDGDSTVAEMLAWTRSPDERSLRQLTRFQCDDEVADNPNKPLIACDTDDPQSKYLLSPAIIQGTQLDDAGYGIPQNDVQYVVSLDFDGDATTVFSEVTRAITGTQERFAIVLDGDVLSAPVVNNPITDGNAEISGSFTQASAESLANKLKYGALPLTFEAPVVTEEGPTLAADQLSAGLLAGGFGLGLVLIYCMLYYRGLGVVVVTSLAVAAAITYAAVLFLSENAGFTLTLPGIAGLIVAVGITADSFIVYFERIRDEMREGKSVRVAVEAGWDRAKMTCVAADAVSLLAAVVLYIFAIGVVKGFAFALGISTLIDLVVFFLFTKPMVTWLARFDFFSRGHKWSGLSPDHVGIDRIGRSRPEGATA